MDDLAQFEKESLALLQRIKTWADERPYRLHIDVYVDDKGFGWGMTSGKHVE